MKEHIRQVLSQRKIERGGSSQSTPSAVILPLYRKDDEWFILFTKRTETVDTHKGHISFPGGLREKEDKTLEDTARRETSEELGIAASNIEILGRLDDQITHSGDFVISPFVGILPYPHKFNINHCEVAQVIEVPLKYLLTKGTMREGLCPFQNGVVTAYFWQYHEHLIWGATGRILKRFLELVFPQGYQDIPDCF